MKRKNKNERIIISLTRTALVLGFLLAWEFCARKGFYNGFFTSYPSEILMDLVEFYKSGALAKHTAITLTEAFLGLLYGTLIGIVTAIIFGYFSALGKVISPIITAISGIPQLTLAPVYVLWFGLGLTSKIFLAGLMVFFNVFFSTYNAIKNIDRRLIESANLLGASNIRTLRTVVIPACMPWILSGIRGGVGSALVGAIIGEYIGSSGGFGWMITYSTSFFNIKRVMSCILILLLVGIILNKLLDFAESKMLIWKTDTTLSMKQK
ncbi:MAG: ssuC [Clostridiales bacterium]|nr:ssuC [Clostridiales bacterium]